MRHLLQIPPSQGGGICHRVVANSPPQGGSFQYKYTANALQVGVRKHQRTLDTCHNVMRHIILYPLLATHTWTIVLLTDCNSCICHAPQRIAIVCLICDEHYADSEDRKGSTYVTYCDTSPASSGKPQSQLYTTHIMGGYTK